MTIVLDPTSDQEQILDSVRKVLAERFPVDRLRGPHTESPDSERLRWLLDLGLTGLGSDEAVGGTGLGIVEEMLVFVELGRNLVTPGVLAGTIGARLACELGDRQLARRLISGKESIGIANPLTPFSFKAIEAVETHFVDARTDGLALLWDDNGIGLVHCDGLAMERVTSADRSVMIHRGRLRDGCLVGHRAAGNTPLLQQLYLLLAAQLLGMTEACRDMAVEYARLRTQFGQPIGVFQAIKHRCANMAIQAEALRAQVVMATMALRYGWPDAAFQVDACRMLAAPYALAAARSNIQIHGGMGFTAECNAHLYMLRAHLYDHLGSTLEDLQQRLLSRRFPETTGEAQCASH